MDRLPAAPWGIVGSGSMKTFVVVVLGLHGLIHVLGFAKAFGLAELAQLTQPLSRRAGSAWLVAGLLMLATLGGILAGWQTWWIPAALGAVLSQVLVFSAWTDARFATLPNLIVLAAAVYGFAAQGPLSFRSAYLHATSAQVPGEAAGSALTEADVAPLPAPVRRYVIQSGALGQPRVHQFGATWQGRIRGAPNEPWMSFTAEQQNFLDEPSRFFHMKARKLGMPVDVLHVYQPSGASMRVRLLSLLSMAEASGPEMDRSETVTLFNDISLLAPGALVHPSIAWEPIDSRTARGHLTVGDITVSAVLIFNHAGELVDFVSDDRSAASPDGTAFTPMRWSTPVSAYGRFGPYRVFSAGKGVWDTPSGPFAYIELELESLTINGRDFDPLPVS